MFNFFCDTREVIYVVASCLDRCLLNFTARKFRSVIIVMKILKVLHFDTKFSIKQYFLDFFSLKRKIYQALESS